MYGQDAYPTLHGKAAALLHSLVSNRALVDGNKRLGWQATAVFLWIKHTAGAHSPAPSEPVTGRATSTSAVTSEKRWGRQTPPTTAIARGL
jgi:hypothetical protein